MGDESNNLDSQIEVGQLLSGVGFPEEGKKVLRAMNERITDLTRENLRLKKENSELQALNTSLQKLMKRVERQLNQWRESYMKNG
jgi:predicted RNase H-like nuclease (RuvC/YqgF family)